MLKSLANAAKTLAKGPQLVVPGLVAAAVILGLIVVFSGFFVSIAVNAFILDILPEVPLNELPVYFASMYAVDLLGILVLSFLTGLVAISLSYWYALYVKDREEGSASIIGTCRKTLGSIGKIAALLVFFLIIAAFFGVVFWVLLQVVAASELAGFLLVAILALLAFYLYIKLVFTVQALAIEQGTVKQALQQSWLFSQKRFLPVLIFVVIVSIITTAILEAGFAAGDSIGEELAAIAIGAVFFAIASAYSNLAMALYYLEKKLGKSL